MKKYSYPDAGKRLFDLLVVLPLIFCLSPLLLLVAILIRLDSAGPILFVQERLGKGAITFPIYKFRTMTNRQREIREIMGYSPEVTRIGYWLRRFKLDELPQLLNILKGDMSLIGPRPAMPSQLSEYDANGFKRLQVRPGLTGLAQVHGNIYLSWPERWQYDARYVDTVSLWTDLKIIGRTIWVIIRGEDHFLARPDF